MTLPSKELLSGVLKCVCTEVKEINGSDLYYEAFGVSEINIHEPTNKCKEWAFKQGYSVYATQYAVDQSGWCLYVYSAIGMHDYGLDISCNTFETEPEAILKAC